jgi:colanic acid biosynthesis glycosyl transferase WcaI
MKKNKILFIGHNFSPEPTGIGKYSGEMIAWLAKDGFECTVVTTYPYYPFWKVQPPYTGKWYKKEYIKNEVSGAGITIYRCPLYIPAKLTGKTRMLHDLSFVVSKAFIMIKLIFEKKHDFLINVAPPFHVGFLAWFYKKVRGAKILYHIQDLQIEAAQDLNMISGKSLFRILYKAEKFLLKNSDFVSTISPGMVKKVQAKIRKPVILFPNWADTDFFFPIDDKETLKAKWGFTKDQVVFLYSGSIGEKQGLENIVYAAEQLKDYVNYQFVICGSGPHKVKLERLVSERLVNNIVFLPVQSNDVFNQFLNMADIHLIIQKAGASDFVMPSKLTTILAVGGVSLVTALPGTTLFDVVDKFDVGFISEPDDYMDLTETIKTITMDNLAIKKTNARNYAVKYLNVDNILANLVKDISLN